MAIFRPRKVSRSSTTSGVDLSIRNPGKPSPGRFTPPGNSPESPLDKPRPHSSRRSRSMSSASQPSARLVASWPNSSHVMRLMVNDSGGRVDSSLSTSSTLARARLIHPIWGPNLTTLVTRIIPPRNRTPTVATEPPALTCVANRESRSGGLRSASRLVSAPTVAGSGPRCNHEPDANGCATTPAGTQRLLFGRGRVCVSDLGRTWLAGALCRRGGRGHWALPRNCVGGAGEGGRDSDCRGHRRSKRSEVTRCGRQCG
jgi:hypothetical protein